MGTGFEHLKTTVHAQATPHGTVFLTTESRCTIDNFEGGKTTHEMLPDQAVALGHDLIAAGEAALGGKTK